MIIEYDFGKKDRPAAKRFAKPAAIEGGGPRTLGNAQMHLEQANGRIAKLEAALRRAHAAASGKSGSGKEQILVDAAEYARLVKCRDLVAAALAES